MIIDFLILWPFFPSIYFLYVYFFVAMPDIRFHFHLVNLSIVYAISKKFRMYNSLPYLVSLLLPAGNEQVGRGKQILFISYRWFRNSRCISTNPTSLRKCPATFKMCNSMVSCFIGWQQEWSYFRYSFSQCYQRVAPQTVQAGGSCFMQSNDIPVLFLYMVCPFPCSLHLWATMVIEHVCLSELWLWEVLGLKSLIPVSQLSVIG